jgi:RNA polymerase sigma-70 factor (ECF subfamily)
MWAIRDSFGVFPATVPMGETSTRSTPGTEAADGAARNADGRPLDAAMDRYARGDASAFDALYRVGAPRVRGFLLRLCGDPALADDLTQEAFVRVHRARGAFEPGAAALPWFFAIARNAFVDHRRREHARRGVSAALPAGEGGLAEAEADADARGDEVLAASEMLDVVRATLDSMTALQREAFVLVRFEGLSIAEAAQVLGATEAAVKIRAFRAYEALRAALDRRNKEAR